MKQLDEIRAKFLSPDIDPEDREDNERLLKEWEAGLIQNEAYISWQEHDITREIAQKMKEEFKEFAQILSENRTLTQEQRVSLWAKQDACRFILSLTEKDARGQIEQIQSEVKRASSVT